MACESRAALLVVPLQPVSQRLKCSLYRIGGSTLEKTCLFSLPDFAENLAADTFLANLIPPEGTQSTAKPAASQSSIQARLTAKR